MNTEEILEKLMEYYEVHTISDLAKILEIGQPAISKWKINNSINTIKKKCRELGIYDEIFGNKDTQTNDLRNANIGGSGVDNSKGSSHTFNNSSIDNIIPDYIAEDLANLFKRAKGNEKELIDTIDEFIAAQKKIYRPI